MPTNSGGQTINFSGLASGLDSNSLISAMVAVRHQRIDQVQSQQATLNNHKTLYSNVMSALQALNMTAMGMDSRRDFGPMQATTSNGDVLTAAAGAGAAAAAYSVRVQQVATAQRTYSDGLTDRQQAGAFGTGTITVRYGDKPAQNITVDENSTLQSIGDSINNLGLGVNATVINEGGTFRLALNGAETGAANAFSITEDGTTTGLSRPGNTAQAAQDARLVVDDFTTISRPTNTINDAIPGVTLQVRGGSAETQTVRIGVDAAGVKNQIQDFVNGYNSVITAVNSATQFKRSYDPNQLTGDSNLRDVTMALQRLVTTPIGAGTIRSLSQIGITTKKEDGTLVVDSKKLDAALAADYNGVAHLFINDPSTGTRGVAAAMNGIQKKFTDFFEGSLSRAIKGISSQVDKMNLQVDTMQRNLDAYQQSLQYKFRTLETTVSRLQSQGQYISRLQQTQSNSAQQKR